MRPALHPYFAEALCVAAGPSSSGAEVSGWLANPSANNYS